MSDALDLHGKRFGKLTVMNKSGRNARGRSQWLCICDCGRHRDVIGYRLKANEIENCGAPECRRKTGRPCKPKAPKQAAKPKRRLPARRMSPAELERERVDAIMRPDGYINQARVVRELGAGAQIGGMCWKRIRGERE